MAGLSERIAAAAAPTGAWRASVHAALTDISDEAGALPRGGLAPPAGGSFLPYRVVESIGAGGMGLVLRVQHEETGVHYALKTLLAREGADPAALERARLRFAREAELNARLDHPGVVRVHAAQLEGELPWLVLDLVEGQDLAERVEREGPLAPERALRLAASIADALAHAHARGVLHRDLKPENVLIDERDEARLVDFGLAISLREHSLRMTAAGEILGTPAFLAPEQIAQRGGQDAPCVDLYGLGGVLYFALTGRPPLDLSACEHMVAALQTILRTAPAPPSSLRPELSPEVDALVAGLLVKDPAQRTSLPQLREQLRRLRAGEGLGPRAARRRWAPLLAGALATLALGVTLAASLGPSEQEALRAAEAWSERAASSAALFGSAALAWDAEELAQREERVRELRGLRAEALQQRLAACRRLRAEQRGAPAPLPPDAPSRDPLARAIDARLLLGRGQREAARARLGQLPPDAPGAAELTLLLEGSSARLCAARARLAPELVPWAEDALRRRLLAELEQVSALAGLHELGQRWRSASAAGYDLAPLSAAKRARADALVGAWVQQLAREAELPRRLRELGEFLREAPPVALGVEPRWALRRALGALVEERAPGSFDRGGPSRLARLLGLVGLAWLEVSPDAAPGAAELVRSLGHVRQEHDKFRDPVEVAGALRLVPSQRARRLIFGLEVAELRALRSRYPTSAAPTFLLVLKLGSWDEPHLRAPPLALLREFEAQLRDPACDLPRRQRAFATGYVAIHLAELLRRSPRPDLAREVRGWVERCRSHRLGWGQLELAVTRAEARARHLLGLDPHGVAAWQACVAAMRAPRKGTLDRVERQLRDLPDALAGLARALADAGRPQDALARVDEAIALLAGRPNEHGMWLDQLVVKAELLRRFDRAAEAWALIDAEIEPGGFVSRSFAQVALDGLLERAEHRRARALLERARVRFPTADLEELWAGYASELQKHGE